MRRWRRPYPLDVQTVLAIGGLVCLPIVGGGFVLATARGDMSGLQLFLAAVPMAALWSVLARRAMLGVFVSDAGVRSRSFLSAVTVPWSSVSDIRNGTASSTGFYLVDRDAIHIHHADGTDIETPVQRGGHIPFANRPELGRVVMQQGAYDEALAALRRHLAVARRRAKSTPDRSEA